MRRAVTLEARKGIWTHAEVAAVAAGVRELGHAITPPPAAKGVWTLEEVAAWLKGQGVRVWGAPLAGAIYASGAPAGR